MSRYRNTRRSPSSDSSFLSPTVDENQTDYHLEYTGKSRLVNPYDARETRSFARKSTSRGPHAPTRTRTTMQSLARSPPTSSRRGQHTPTRTRTTMQSSARSPPTSHRRGLHTPTRSTTITQSSARCPPISSRRVAHSPTRTRTGITQSAGGDSSPDGGEPPIHGARRRKKNPMSTLQRERRFQREVMMLQRQKTPLISRLPFSRLVREIIREFSTEVTCVTRESFEVLQETTEYYLTQLLADSYLLALHRGRLTLTCRDMQLLQQLRL